MFRSSDKSIEKRAKKEEKLSLDEKITRTAESFNRELSSMFKIINKKMPDNDDVRSYHNRFKLARFGQPTMAIEMNKDNFWNNRNLILDKKTTFFTDASYLTFDEDDAEEAFNRNAEIFSELFDNATDDELEEFWSHIHEMLRYVIIYKQQTNDHE